MENNLILYICKLKNGKNFKFYFTDTRIEELLNSYGIEYVREIK